MVAGYHTIDLSRLALRSGQGRRIDAEVDLGELELAGQRYEFDPRPVPARLDVSRTAAGHAIRLRFSGELRGPCMRCLEPSVLPLEVEAREVDQPGTRDEELTSPYVRDEELDLGAWARDALALAVPGKVLCEPGCPGLCPVCGEPLATGEPHGHEPAPDPRWAPLRDLMTD